MSKRGYGRKVIRSKNLYKKKKSKFKVIAEFSVMAAVVAALVFVGYTIADTVFNYEGGGGTEDVSDYNPPPEPSESESDSESSEQSAEPTDSAGSEPKPKPSEPIGKTIYARANILASFASLSTFIEEAKSEGYEAVVVEMKDEEGKLLYKSNIPDIADDEDIVAGNLTAKQIAEGFSNAGIKPIARISTLKDKIAPEKIKDVSYRFADESYAWLDDRWENGGKPWANPFLSGTKAYISKITAELYEAGFVDIIFANVVFPNFRAYDLTILPSKVTNEKTRYSALADLINEVSKKSPDADVILEISVGDVINGGGLTGTAEILRAKNSLSARRAILIFNRAVSETAATGGDVSTPEELSELVKSVFDKVARQTGELEIIPCADVSGLSESDIEKVVSAFSQMGYDNYIIR
ncbi:MAG: putative glycoside hydrolase [Oscillospiraceae bacterium]|jgi:hypothetical protein|nr:putative glycoside hydrolase [Oscillospiraceae bacterium]